MFDISFWELAMIGVVALIVVGPERLPGLARTTGRWLGKARRMVAEVKAEVDRELQLDELKQSLRQQADLNGVKEVASQMQTLRDDIQAELRNDIQAEYDDHDPGPPPGWHPGMPNMPPPPDYDREPPLNATSTTPAPVLLQKTDVASATQPLPVITTEPPPQPSPTSAPDRKP